MAGPAGRNQPTAKARKPMPSALSGNWYFRLCAWVAWPWWLAGFWGAANPIDRWVGHPQPTIWPGENGADQTPVGARMASMKSLLLPWWRQFRIRILLGQ